MNPIFQAMGGFPRMPGPFGNFQNMMTQFQQFRSSFRGDPKQEVQKLLDSGKMTQQQYNQLAQAAQAFLAMLGGR